jgi:hypothetical protein
MLNKGIINNSEGNFKSLQKELRFKIGEQYELNEFHLKTLKSTFINEIEYENYEYLKDDFKALFGVKFTNNIILQYNGEILYKVIYQFHKKDYNYLYSKVNTYKINSVILKVLVKDNNNCQIVLQKNKGTLFGNSL